MKVILRENVHNLGSLGDEVNVKPGYARNYLIPQGKATQISSTSAKQIQHYKTILAKERAEAIQKARSLSEKINDMELVFTMKAGDTGKLFGSITSKNIEEELINKGIELDKKFLITTSPIKTLGTHKINVKLHSEVDTKLSIKIVADAPPKTASKEDKKVESNDIGEQAVSEAPSQDESTDSE